MSIGGRIARSVFDKAGGDGCVGRKTDPPQTAAGCRAGSAGSRTRARKEDDSNAGAAKGAGFYIHTEKDAGCGNRPAGSAAHRVHTEENEGRGACPGGGTGARIRIEESQGPRPLAADSADSACKNGSRRRG